MLIWVVLLIGLAMREIYFNQSEVTISMEFLQTFLRHHFAGKPVVVSQNAKIMAVSGTAEQGEKWEG